MRVLRSSLFVAATAIIAAACGDKVNLVQPTNGLKIESVAVAPNPATITAGQSVQMTAAVSADAGVTTTVTWSTTNSAVATVSQSGLVAGVASGSVGICAAASATNAATVSSCATVNVSPASTTVNAVIQIASITTQAGGLNAPVPVPPAAVAGQINVSVNVNPGTERMDSVVVMVNGISAASQTFTGAQAAALRAAADAAAAQALQQTLVFSINTAAYSTAGCTTQIAPCGTPSFLNGPATISVVGYGHQGALAATNTVSQGVALLFGNADGWIVAQTYGAGTNGISPVVASAAGFNYVGGSTASVAVTAVPVAYSGLKIASANINYGTAACDASGSAQRTIVATAPVAPSLAWTATFTRTANAAAGVTNVNNYEFSAAACPAANAAGGEGATVANSLYTTNTTGPTAFALGSTVPVVRLDDRAPGTPNLVMNPRIRQNGWINAAVGILSSNTGSAATANNTVNAGLGVGAGAADAGVGGGGFQVRVAPTGVGGIVDGARAATPLTSTTAVIGTGALAPTLAATTDCGIWTAVDALGNESNLPAAGTVCTAPVLASNTVTAAGVNHMQFGVDIAPPTIAMSASGGIAASSAGVGNTGANVGAEYQVTVLDTGTVGNSGMLGGAPVLGTVTVRSAAAGLTAAQLCPVGTPSGTNTCTASATGIAGVALPFVNTTTIAAQTIIGYYTLNAQSVDAAGNVSTNTVTRVVDYNPAANVPALTASLYNTPLTGPTATFTATGSSGNTTVNGPTTFFDLWQVGYNLAYPAASLGAITATALVYPTTTINTFNTAPEVNNNVPVTITIPGFIRQVQTQTSACNVALATTAVAKPTGLNEALQDMVANTSGNVNTVIPPASVTTGVSYVGVAAPQQIATFLLANGVGENPTVPGCPAAVGANAVVKVSGGGTSPAAVATSITLTADAFGPTATFNAPFAQVNFYVYNANTTFLELIGSTTSFSTTDDGSAQGRKQSYTFSWTPGTKTPISGTLWTAAGILSAGGGQSSAACAVGGSSAKFYAVGVSAAGDALFTPVSTNGNICITTAP